MITDKWRGKLNSSLIRCKVQYIAKKDESLDEQIEQISPFKKSVQLPHIPHLLHIVNLPKLEKKRNSVGVDQMGVIMESENEDKQGLNMKQRRYQNEKSNDLQNIFDSSNLVLKHGLSGITPLYKKNKIVKYSLIGTEQEYQNGKTMNQEDESSSRKSSVSNQSQMSNRSSIIQQFR